MVFRSITIILLFTIIGDIHSGNIPRVKDFIAYATNMTKLVTRNKHTTITNILDNESH